MEPKAPSPSGGPSPESAGPILPTPEIPGEVTPAHKVERAPASVETERPSGDAANQNASMTMPAPMPQPVAQPVVSDEDDASKQPIDVDAPDLANDVDVIEKEWVDKAKAIVTKSSNDPHVQNKEVSILKADYMKKRYGKDIKVPNDEPAKG